MKGLLPEIRDICETRKKEELGQLVATGEAFEGELKRKKPNLVTTT
jgi:hypothetical protein